MFRFARIAALTVVLFCIALAIKVVFGSGTMTNRAEDLIQKIRINEG